MLTLPITAIIKTLERPAKLRALITSIRTFYPTLPVIVVDDSRIPLTDIADTYTTYIHTEPDIGASAGRNLAVEHVKTPYTLMLDDDYLFTRQTRLETFLHILATTPFRLVAGEVLDHGTKQLVFRGVFEKDGETLLLHHHKTAGILSGYPVYHYAIQFFLAETALLRQSGWNPKLKTVDHEEFFWRLHQQGIPVTSTSAVKIQHFPDYKQGAYNHEFVAKRRARVQQFYALSCAEMGVADFRHVGSPHGGLTRISSTLRLWAHHGQSSSYFWRMVFLLISAKRRLFGSHE